ncbi:efflux RND transporter permease subunit [Leptospira selangorensis]|uniref:Efflux RND transporter permease subunit n=1 Tax=Leptospira selangorensis TaxID=2484982 RepID=A0A5F2C403_9LEPT|nr:efflux RND transporter permease subunit [Leptospira selangorensis]TGM11219.1 efflux RND transporter permease subunit [Leptospira selangorensis]TGM23028.1 efflux RND transporter permease subunit [Leptospira selangorensis]
MKSIIEYFLSKSIFVNLLTVLIILAGSFLAVKMNREAFPNINFDIVSISTLYLGASPQEVEKLVTNPLEKAIKEVDGIKEYRSASIEGRSGIVITLDPDTKDTQKVVDDIKSAIDRVEDLPEEVEDPIVTEITTARTPVIEVSITLKDDDGSVEAEKKLRAQAKIVEQALLDISGVAKVSRRGWRETEMQVDILPNSLFGFYLTGQDVIGALRNRNVNVPGGNITGLDKEIILRTIGEFDTPEEISKVHVRGNEIGNAIRIQDIARVTEGLREADYIENVNGTKTVALTVLKRQSADAIKVVDSVKSTVEKFRKGSPEFQYAFVNDLSKYIRRRLNVLISNAAFGMILVTGSLFFFLGWRVALMTALGIPVSFGATFFIMDQFGLTLNLISMFGLVLVVGILVDDAIIICENVYRYIEEGLPPYEATLKGTLEVVSPVTATVTTTIAAFAPLLFMPGIFGKFVFSIPLVVIIALCASLAEAFFILPNHLYDINKGGVKAGEIKEESGWFSKFRNTKYVPALRFALNNPWKMTIGIVALLIASFIIQFLFSKFKLFPGSVDQFYVKVTAKTGASLNETYRYLEVIEKEIAKVPGEDLENYATRVGIIQANPNDPFTKRGKHYGMVMAYLTAEENRKKCHKTDDIIQKLRRKTLWLLNETSRKIEEEKIQKEAEQTKNPCDIPEPTVIPEEFESLRGKLVALEYEKVSGGPPVGKPVAIEIRGDSYDTLLKIAAEYKGVLQRVKGVTDIADDFNEGKDEVRIKVSESLASTAGVSVFRVAQAINTAFQGTVATKIKRTDEEVEVKVRFPESYRKSVDSLNHVYVSNSIGKMIPVSRLVTMQRLPGVSNINHLDGKRLITVTANLAGGKQANSSEANAFAKKIAEEEKIIDKYPGYIVRFGGENKDTEESMGSLGFLFLMALLIMYIIIASQFGSLMQPLVIGSAIPFSFIGVILAFVSHGESFGFLAMLGIVGLAGVVVNDSIVLVDFANTLRRENPNKNIKDILIDTGNLRLRAVTLTTVTTVLGLLPTAYGIGGYDPFLVPMALAFGWGLAFASIITLLMVPVFYLHLYNFQNWFSSKRKQFQAWLDQFSGKKKGSHRGAVYFPSPEFSSEPDPVLTNNKGKKKK